MKNLIVILGVIALTGICGCGRPSMADELRNEKQMKKTSSEAAHAAAEGIATSKKKLQAELEELTQRLNERMNEVPADTTEKTERLRRNLQERQLRVKNALAGLETVSKDQWADMKQKTVKLISEIDLWLRSTPGK